MEGKGQKKNILEVSGTQYKDSKSIANRIGHTLTELCLPFSKEELTRAIQATKNSAPGQDKIHSEIMKHLPPEGLDSLLVLYIET